MAKPKKDPTDNCRMSKEVLRKARMVAADRDVSLPDYLTETLGPIVENELDAIFKKLGKRGPSARRRGNREGESRGE